MEWYEEEDRAFFGETASRYASWAVDNIKTEELTARVKPGEFNREIILQGARAGFITAPLSERAGGAGLDSPGRALVIERMARGLAGPAVLFATHWAALSAIASAPEKDDLSSWLEGLSKSPESENPFLCGLALPAPVVEVEKNILPELLRESGVVKITGDFICPVHPAVCERVIIPIGRTNGRPAVIWAAGPELSEHCKEVFPGSGILEIPLAGLSLEGFEISADSVIADGENGIASASALRREIYIGFGAAMAGNAASSASYAWDYSRERIQTGRLIFEHQELRKMLEGMKTLVEAASSMVFTCAAQSGDDDLDRARRAYMFAGTACETVCQDAVQSLGGYGYMKDYGLERRLRDLKTIQSVLGGHALEWIGGNWE